MRELGQVALCQSRSVCGGGYDFNEGRNRASRVAGSRDLPPPLHDKIRYEILTSELHTDIQGKNYGSSNINYHIPCLPRFHAPPINRFIARGNFPFFFRFKLLEFVDWTSRTTD